MEKKIGTEMRGRFCKIILASLLILTGICIWQSFFYVGGELSLEQYNPLILILGSSLFVLTGLIMTHLLDGCSKNRLFCISAIFFFIIIVELIVFGFNLKYIPSYDLIHIQAEAVDMLDTKKISSIAYYGKYPNQQPLTIILFFIYSAAKQIGITDYNMVGIVCNILMILVSVVFVYKISCFWSEKAGVISLFFFMMDPMLFSWASYYYTDMFCMPFMLGGIWLFIKAEKMDSKKMQTILMILAAFMIFIGGKIRITALFALIAILCWCFIKLPLHLFLKRTSILMIGVICAVILSSSILNTYGIKDRNYEYPVTHWIKLGLNEEGNGAYTAEDEVTTKEQNTYEEKVKENVETIRKRLETLGIYGVEKLYLKKMTRTWATAAYTEPLQRTVEEYNTLYKYTIGRSSVIFNYWLQIVRCGMLILIFIGCIFEIRSREYRNTWMFILIFGGIVFYLFWEAKPKYSLSFLPIFYIIQSYSAVNINKFAGYVTERSAQKGIQWPEIINVKRWIQGISCLVILFTIITGILTYSKYIVKQGMQTDLRVNQSSFSPQGKINEIKERKGISQSFIAEGDFNTIEIRFLNPRHLKNQKYVLEIFDENGTSLLQTEFLSDDVEHNRMHIFKLKRIKARNEKCYLNIRPKQIYDHYIGANSAVYSLYTGYKKAPDYYPQGCLYQGETKLEKNDLTFIVSDQYKDAAFSPRFFFVIWGAVIILEIGISRYLLKILC